MQFLFEIQKKIDNNENLIDFRLKSLEKIKKMRIFIESFEIYNEEIFDLQGNNKKNKKKTKVKIKENENKKVYLKGKNLKIILFNLIKKT